MDRNLKKKAPPILVNSQKRLPSIPIQHDKHTMKEAAFPKPTTYLDREKLIAETFSSEEVVSDKKTPYKITYTKYNPAKKSPLECLQQEKFISFMNLNDEDKKRLNDPIEREKLPFGGQYNYTDVTEVFKPKQYFKSRKDILSRNNIASLVFVVFSLVTTIVSIHGFHVNSTGMRYKSDYYVDSNTEEDRQETQQLLRASLDAPEALFIYCKIYTLIVSIFVVVTKTNSQTVLLLVYSFVISILEIVCIILLVLPTSRGYKSQLELLAEAGIDIHHIQPHLQAQLNKIFLIPRTWGYIALGCLVVGFVGQFVLWVFLLAKHFSWATFMKTGASVKARQIIDSTNFFYSLSIVFCGLLPPFCLIPYMCFRHIKPPYSNNFFIVGSCPVICALLCWAYKKKSFWGLVGLLVYLAYTFFSVIEITATIEAKVYLVSAIYMYYLSGLVFIVSAALIWYTLKRLAECDLHIEISNQLLRGLFLGCTNFFSLIFGCLELAFYLCQKDAPLTIVSLKTCTPWIYCFAYSLLGCILFSAYLMFVPRKDTHLSAIHLCWTFGCFIFIFQYSTALFTYSKASSNMAETLIFGFLGLVLVFWTVLTVLLLQLRKNMDVFSDHSIEVIQKTEDHLMVELCEQEKATALNNSIILLIVFICYLLGVYCISYVTFKTEYWHLLLSENQTTIACLVIGVMFCLSSYSLMMFCLNELLSLGVVMGCSLLLIGYPAFTLVDIAKQYAPVENELLFPETTHLKIIMSISVVLILANVVTVFLAGWAIMIKKGWTLGRKGLFK